MFMAISASTIPLNDNLFLFTLTLLLGMFSWVVVIVYYYQVWKEYYGRYFWITLGAGCMLVIPVFAYLNVLYAEDAFLGTIFAFLALVSYMLGALFFLKGGFGFKADFTVEHDDARKEKGKREKKKRNADRETEGEE